MVRGARAVLAACLGIGFVMAIVTVRSPAPASKSWAEFSIGPATGRNTNINPSSLQSEGMTLRAALSVAYAIPQVRIVGPDWLDWQRYSITAIIDPAAGGFFPALFQ